MVNWLQVGMVAVNIITVVLEGMCAILFEEKRQPQWVVGIETSLQIIMLVSEWQKHLRLERLYHY